MEAWTFGTTALIAIPLAENRSGCYSSHMCVKIRGFAAAVFLAAPGLLRAQERSKTSAVEVGSLSEVSAPVQLGFLSLPLSSLDAPRLPSQALGENALAPSAVSAEVPVALKPQERAVVAQAFGGTASEARTAAAPPAKPRPATPYFAKVLVRLGAGPDLAAHLGDAASAPSQESHAAPGRTPDLVAAALEGPAGAELSKREKIAVIAAALAAAHPELSKSGALISELEAQAGLSAQDVSALIEAAGYEAPGGGAEQSSREAWTASWGRRVAFAARLAASARNLLRAKDQNEQIRAEKALDALRRSPDFTIFPAAVERSIRALVNAAQERRLGLRNAALNESAHAQAPPSPMQAAALAEARREASALGLPEEAKTATKGSAASSAGAGALAALKNGGYAIVPPDEVPESLLEKQILRAIDRSLAKGPGGFWLWEFLDQYSGAWQTNKRQTPELVADVRRFVESLTRALQAALPEEGIEIRDVQIRVDAPSKTDTDPHIDGAYITATCALRGPGTIIYDDAGGRVKRLQAPEGAVAFLSNMEREFARGIPGAIHTAPWSGTSGRVVLIVRYKSANRPYIFSRDVRRWDQTAAKRISAVKKALRRMR